MRKGMDVATLLGLVIAFGAILGGNALEGGHLGSILQPTAAIIVFGGTLGAIAVQFPAAALGRTLRDVKLTIKPSEHDTAGTLKTIVSMANKARRDGLLVIEQEAAKLSDPFLRRGLELAVDGTEARALRAALEIELSRTEEEGEQSARVLEAGGGYAPTVGILGAVLGLIHVMENLSDPSKLGGGIAVAFVATVYGVAVANLVFLPLAGKLKLRHREHTVQMELVIEGVCAIAEGENPRLIERKLSVYASERSEGATRVEAEVAAQRVSAAA
jgi:chemotaxis protein MotA